MSLQDKIVIALLVAVPYLLLAAIALYTEWAHHRDRRVRDFARLLGLDPHFAARTPERLRARRSRNEAWTTVGTRGRPLGSGRRFETLLQTFQKPGPE